jgi:hypothetical protein
MKYFTVMIILLLLAIGVTGCSSGISKESYDAAVKEASDLSDQLSVVQTALAAAQDDIDSYKTEVSSLQDEISSYESQVADYESQINALQFDLDVANIEIGGLQNENDNLWKLSNLELKITEADAVTVTMTSGVKTQVVSFEAKYAGYIVISGTSSTFWGVIFVTESFDGYLFNNYQYDFGKGATFLVPVLPGTITVYFAATQSSELMAATITVEYYY